MTRQHDTQTLIESFGALADEVQSLIDRKTILEHKLRFAAEQYQQLADKYAPTAPEVSETLAKLQLPPDLHRTPVPSSYVPLPRRGSGGCNQHQIALLIRDGRRAAQQLNQTDTSGSSKETSSGTATTTMSTIMEQDFTVEGKKGVLDCPFSAMKREQQLQRQKEQLDRQRRASRGAESQNLDDKQQSIAGTGSNDPTPHQSNDPICAAMFEDITSQPAPSSTGAARCPIRYLDQHSPEEIAHYVETHKHQLPRSHAICLRRYHKSEEQIRKLDAKYGSLVSMISGLGQFHQPMLGAGEEAIGDEPVDVEDRAAMHTASNERVKNWANGVSASDGEGMTDGPNDRHGQDVHSTGDAHDPGAADDQDGVSGTGADAQFDGDNTVDDERESRFDRPLKEVRVGESPSRPWGISVPVLALPDESVEPPPSPPAAPVHMPSRPVPERFQPPIKMPAKRCPFDHSKLGMGGAIPMPDGHPNVDDHEQDHEQDHGHGYEQEGLDVSNENHRESNPDPPPADETERHFTPQKPNMPDMPRPSSYPSIPQTSMPQTTPMQSSTMPHGPPTFLNFPPQVAAGQSSNGTPQMLFTGPVFIGYPIEQAIQFMQHFQGTQGT